MLKQWPTANKLVTLLCTLFLALPSISNASSGDEIAQLRTQLQALSARLDQLESENRRLAASNTALARNSQETAKTVAGIDARTESMATELHAQTSDWTDTIKWKGDFRYRYEGFDIEGKPGRNRNRLRARAAMLARVTPDIEVGLGLASGGDDPVSTNQTLGDGTSTKGLNLDLAYFDYSGFSNTHVRVGKFSNFLHRSGKNALLWDDDWRPEGGGLAWSHGKVFVNGLGTWIESDNKKDQSFAGMLQAGVNFPLGETLKMSAGAGYYNFDTKGSGTFYGNDTNFYGNSFDPTSNTYLYDYEEFELFADLGFELYDRPVQLFGNWVQNRAADDDDTAYAFGLKYGKAKNPGQWEFGYTYQKLEKDSAFGLLTNSDFAGGNTDSRGHIFKGSYAIAKNFNAKFTYYVNETGLSSGHPADYKRLQLDLSFKY